MTDLELRALSIKCPLCQARAQSLCINTMDKEYKLNTPHVARIDRYLELQNKSKE